MAPDFQPYLTGDTAVLRPLHADDWAGMLKAASDPRIWALHPVNDRYKEAVFRVFFDGGLASGMALAIIERAGGRIIGSSRYHAYDPVSREVEIGWTFLICDHWGRGTNAEIKRLMLDHAFTFADVVVFWVGETNWRSQRAMEKIGGIRRPGLHRREMNGVAYDHVVFEIARDGYQELRHPRT